MAFAVMVDERSCGFFSVHGADGARSVDVRNLRHTNIKQHQVIVFDFVHIDGDGVIVSYLGAIAQADDYALNDFLVQNIVFGNQVLDCPPP
jgi:hypothetical protein